MGTRKTYAQFVDEANAVHEELYTYPPFEYKNNRTEVPISCEMHGIFWQKPLYHLQGSGCPSCSGKKKSNLEEFIEKARKKHGDKYIYTEFIYDTNYKKGKIGCPEHGPFWQNPNNHLNGAGCPECGLERMKKKLRMTKEEFIRRANIVHENKYTYEEFEYEKGNKEGKINCSDHGYFWQTPAIHLSGQGCKKCGFEASVKKRKGQPQKSSKTTRNSVQSLEDFIFRANLIHNNKYIYDDFIFVDPKTKGIIGCKQHGKFLQSPNCHLQGKGCRECGYELVSEKLRLTVEEFIKLAREVHGDKYGYGKVKFKNGRSKTIIDCPEHGEFEQMVGNHLRGTGCPECGFKNLSENIVFEFLSTLGTEVVREYNLYKKYRVDFYLPILNLAVEYNGRQHYEPVEFSNEGEEALNRFIKQQERDCAIREYCKSSNIILLEIDGRIYKRKNKIITFLLEFFKNYFFQCPHTKGPSEG